MGVDRIYTVLNKLGSCRWWCSLRPIHHERDRQVIGSWGVAAAANISSWFSDRTFVSFLLYFVLYDCAAYWLHRPAPLRLVVGAYNLHQASAA